MQILIVADQDSTRHYLMSLLANWNGCQVIAAVNSAESGIGQAIALQPDIIIFDLGVPKPFSTAAIKAMKKACPNSGILILAEKEDVDQIVRSLHAGASGYFLKNAEHSQIIDSIQELKSGGFPMSRSVARRILREFQASPSVDDEPYEMISPLSKREMDILNRLYKGDSYSQIAKSLKLSIHTVHAHIKKIYLKLHVNSRAQAIYEAVRRKLIS